MSLATRRVVGSLFSAFAILTFLQSDGAYTLPLFLAMIGISILWSDVWKALRGALRLLRSVGSMIVVRAQATDEMRYCKCCGALATYVVTTCVPNPNAIPPIPKRRNIYVCRAHHPNPAIGKEHADLKRYVTQHIHPDATSECIYPHRVF